MFGHVLCPAYECDAVAGTHCASVLPSRAGCTSMKVATFSTCGVKVGAAGPAKMACKLLVFLCTRKHVVVSSDLYLHHALLALQFTIC